MILLLGSINPKHNFSATNRLITSKDHASVQINVGHLDENGVYTGQFSTFALCGFVRAQGDADSALDRLWQKKKAEVRQQIVFQSGVWKEQMKERIRAVAQTDATLQYHDVNADSGLQDSAVNMVQTKSNTGIASNWSSTKSILAKVRAIWCPLVSGFRNDILEEHDQRKERRKQSNRESAKRSRCRRQEECRKLQAKAEDLAKETSNLRAGIMRVSKECRKLKKENKSIMKGLEKMYGPDAVGDLKAEEPGSVTGDGESSSDERRKTLAVLRLAPGSRTSPLSPPVLSPLVVDSKANMQNEEGVITELYIPRKCSATNRLITSKDHASVQLNVGHLDENGVYTGQFSTFALCGFVRAQGDADSALDRLWQKKKAEEGSGYETLWNQKTLAVLRLAPGSRTSPLSPPVLSPLVVDSKANMQNEEGVITELYIPRKCSATNRLITSKDHASVQLNIGHLDENGVYTGQFSTFALCGFVRAQGDADSALDRLWQKKKAEVRQ
ncbi:hypothetical protein FEM48_Zijuj12G0191400 [Ziziphus jujuba var. spinosa]|uniref:BZIP domain-containing protein n=1 Tax=Ziziphus jujuba var. spinosa TaxID=714518 RepID=A0A978UF13_ZIZJJ|nr:hypothetical protein FEM48_Zijuj12G0191400 [Ziziphus jujuba var. spinosa]